MGTTLPPQSPVIHRWLSADSPGNAITPRSTLSARYKGLSALLTTLLLRRCLPDLAAIYCSFNGSLLNVMA